MKRRPSEPDSSRDSSRRQRKTEGPKDERVKVKPFPYFNFSLIKGASDKYEDANKKSQPRRRRR